MHLTSFIWWMIILLNIGGYFVFRFGMVSHGFRKHEIEFIGGVIVSATFVWMFLEFGWKAALILVPIFWFFSTPVVEVILRKVDKKLYGKLDKHFSQQWGVDESQVQDDRMKYTSMTEDEVMVDILKNTVGSDNVNEKPGEFTRRIEDRLRRTKKSKEQPPDPRA